MAIMINDMFHAAAQVAVAGGVPSYTSQRGFSGTIVDNGPGDFTLTFDNAVDPTARTVQVTPTSGATFATATVQDVDDASVRIRTFDAAGVALDNIGVAVTVMRHIQ